MPTLQCPNCGQTVRFEGVAGICPSCASVVMVPKDFSEVKPPPPVPKSGRPSLESLGDLAGGEPTIFEPAPIDEPRKIAGMDPGVVITLCAVAVVLVAFGVYVIVHSMGGSAGQTKVVAAPAPPPSLLNLPEAPAVAPPPPAPSPPTSAPAAAAPPPPPPPAWTLLRPVRPPPSDASVLTDAKVSQAIERAVDFYLKELDDEKRFVTDRSHGIFVLCAYALLHAGQSIDDPRLGAGSPKMQHVLELMKKIEFFDFQTYSHSLRAAALALLNRPADRETLTADLQWLLKASHKGSYSYDIGPTTAYDNSNSQYGMLGVWAASDAGFSVPTTYWNEVEQHWLSCQREEGAWEYIPTAGASLTMTAAGVTSLTVCFGTTWAGVVDPRSRRRPCRHPRHRPRRRLDGRRRSRGRSAFQSRLRAVRYGTGRACNGLQVFWPAQTGIASWPAPNCGHNRPTDHGVKTTSKPRSAFCSCHVGDNRF